MYDLASWAQQPLVSPATAVQVKDAVFWGALCQVQQSRLHLQLKCHQVSAMRVAPGALQWHR